MATLRFGVANRGGYFADFLSGFAFFFGFSPSGSLMVTLISCAIAAPGCMYQPFTSTVSPGWAQEKSLTFTLIDGLGPKSALTVPLPVSSVSSLFL